MYFSIHLILSCGSTGISLNNNRPFYLQSPQGIPPYESTLFSNGQLLEAKEKADSFIALLRILFFSFFTQNVNTLNTFIRIPQTCLPALSGLTVAHKLFVHSSVIEASGKHDQFL